MQQTRIYCKLSRNAKPTFAYGTKESYFTCISHEYANSIYTYMYNTVRQKTDET